MSITRITPDWLRHNDACAEQVAIFAAEWPDGADITLDNARRAAALGLDLDWLAERVFTATALAEYERATATAFAAAMGASREEQP